MCIRDSAQAGQLRDYDWPGNVRELKNLIERAVILSTGKSLRLDLAMPGFQAGAPVEDVVVTSSDEVMTEKEMREFQKANIRKALEQSSWKVSGAGGAAELLGVRPTTLADRIRTLKLKRPAK